MKRVGQTIVLYVPNGLVLRNSASRFLALAWHTYLSTQRRILSCSTGVRMLNVRFSAALLILCAGSFAQIPGPNVNMVSGTTWPGGDPFLQRQNEPSMA